MCVYSSCDIRYSEGIQSLNWTKIMKTITDDPEGFFENGGWTFLDPESGSEDGGGSSEETEEDDNYEPSDFDDDDESDDDSEYSEASEDSGDSEEGEFYLVFDQKEGGFTMFHLFVQSSVRMRNLAKIGPIWSVKLPKKIAIINTEKMIHQNRKRETEETNMENTVNTGECCMPRWF